MHHQFTPAAHRALEHAATWTSDPDSTAIDLPAVLLGLVAEPECRSALVLSEYQIDTEAIHNRWPSLSTLEAANLDRPPGHSIALASALRTAEARLFEYPRPLVLATEHLLLGIVSIDSEASRWLREHGLDPDALEAEIHRFSGHQPGPLPIDDLEEPATEEVNSAPPASKLEISDIEVAVLLDADEPAELEELGRPADETSIGVLRIIDAAANRAGEGLRVVEDYVRFVLDDRHLTQLSKQMRHDLAAALSAVPAELRHAARETQADVGAAVSVPAEQYRTDAASVAAASLKRTQQSLRSLEEYAKTFDSQLAGKLEQLRYRSYTLERAVDVTRSSLERLAGAHVYVLIDAASSEDRFAELVTSLVAAGVHIIQLRDKTLDDRRLLARARLLRELIAGRETLFIMNDRPDLAALARADGVHVGQEELAVKDARQIVGPRALVGVSTHSLDQARRAVLDGANYIGVGPTFPSGTKQFASFPGVELLRSVSAEIRLPAFAIGGVNLENVRAVLEAGFSRAAISGAITRADSPALAAQQFIRQLATNSQR